LKLNEQFVLAHIQELYDAMDKDNKLRTLLTTKAQDLPTTYLYLIEELTDNYIDKTLLYVIETSCNMHYKGTKTVSLFSKAGNQLIGFAAYIIRDNSIDEIKMFSFDINKPNIVMIRDLYNLINQFLKDNYKNISWSALIQNPANAIYQKAIERFNGTVEQKNNVYHYTILNNNFKMTENFLKIHI